MSKEKRTVVFTRELLDLQKAVEDGDKEKFITIFREKASILNGCAVGDAYLSQCLVKVCYEALNKFVLNLS